MVDGDLERTLLTGVSLGGIAPPANPDSFIDNAVYRHVTGKVLVIYPRDIFKLTPEIVSGKGQLDGAKHGTIVEILVAGNGDTEDRGEQHENSQASHSKGPDTAFNNRMIHLLKNLLRKKPHEHWPCTNCNDRIERIHSGTLRSPLPYPAW